MRGKKLKEAYILWAIRKCTFYNKLKETMLIQDVFI